MTKKKILNVTTVKKRDNMQSYTNMLVANGVPGSTYSFQAALIGAHAATDVNINHPKAILWNATARDLTDFASVVNTRANEAARTASVPYMVGLREVVEIQSPNGLPWQWRRICFTYKGGLPGAVATSTFRTYTETSSGYGRVVNQVPGDRNSGATYDLYNTIFAGQNASDWNDPMVAKLDQTRISVKYDKTRKLETGNEAGFIRSFRHFHSMGHNLAYDDDENGAGMTTTYTSVDSKVGMGDYYILDLFRSRFGADGGNAIIFNPSATLYWHEK